MARRPRLISRACYAPLDEGKRELESCGFRIISLEEDVKLRLKEGVHSLISEQGNWVREAFLYLPQRGIFLTKNSPILDSLEEVIQVYREELRAPKRNLEYEYGLSSQQVEEALSDSIKINPVNENVQTRRLHKDPVAVFAFGRYTKGYGKLVNMTGALKMNLWVYNQDYVDRQGKPFAHQIWFNSISGGSVLFGSIGQLCMKKKILGVKELPNRSFWKSLLRKAA